MGEAEIKVLLKAHVSRQEIVTPAIVSEGKLKMSNLYVCLLAMDSRQAERGLITQPLSQSKGLSIKVHTTKMNTNQCLFQIISFLRPNLLFLN